MSSSLRHQGSLGLVTHLPEFPRLHILSNRYYIGESLVPSVRHYLKFIDTEEKIANRGFEIKVRTCYGGSVRRAPYPRSLELGSS